MTPARFLNLIGLVISLIAAILMFFFPYYSTPVVQNKEGHHVEGLVFTTRKVPSWKVHLAKLGPILLGAGFLLQIVAVFI
jgi:hypothetical protein